MIVKLIAQVISLTHISVYFEQYYDQIVNHAI